MFSMSLWWALKRQKNVHSKFQFIFDPLKKNISKYIHIEWFTFGFFQLFRFYLSQLLSWSSSLQKWQLSNRTNDHLITNMLLFDWFFKRKYLIKLIGFSLTFLTLNPFFLRQFSYPNFFRAQLVLFFARFLHYFQI